MMSLIKKKMNIKLKLNQDWSWDADIDVVIVGPLRFRFENDLRRFVQRRTVDGFWYRDAWGRGHRWPLLFPSWRCVDTTGSLARSPAGHWLIYLFIFLLCVCFLDATHSTHSWIIIKSNYWYRKSLTAHWKGKKNLLKNLLKWIVMVIKVVL